MMDITFKTIFINTYKEALQTASHYQGELFSTGCTLWNWTPPQFNNTFRPS
jgi:hypothetical protein